MIVPAAIMPKAEDIRDPADIPKPDPQPHDDQNTLLLREGELIICKDDPSSTEWYVAEVWKVLPDKAEVKYGWVGHIKPKKCASPSAKGSTPIAYPSRQTVLCKKSQHPVKGSRAVFN